jgi:pimeloyl-ACP methyl ester carboxylesterase
MNPTWQLITSAPPVTVRTAAGDVEYARFGQGPAVILLHGAMGGYDQSLILGAAAIGGGEFDLIAVSRPGYLGTPLPGPTDPVRQAGLCAALLDTLGVERAAVIAVSGGGQCALQFALRHNNRCTGLVLISACTAPLTAPLPLRFHLINLLTRIPAMASFLEKQAEQHRDQAAARSIPDPGMLARTLRHPLAGPLFEALQRSTSHNLFRRMPGTRNDIEFSRQPFDYPLEQITAPTLVIHGTDDQVVPFTHSQALAARLPRAELLALDAGPHCGLFTHLDQVQTSVRRFLTMEACAVGC